MQPVPPPYCEGPAIFIGNTGEGDWRRWCEEHCKKMAVLTRQFGVMLSLKMLYFFMRKTCWKSFFPFQEVCSIKKTAKQSGGGQIT